VSPLAVRPVIVALMSPLGTSLHDSKSRSSPPAVSTAVPPVATGCDLSANGGIAEATACEGVDCCESAGGCAVPEPSRGAVGVALPDAIPGVLLLPVLPELLSATSATTSQANRPRQMATSPSRAGPDLWRVNVVQARLAIVVGLLPSVVMCSSSAPPDHANVQPPRAQARGCGTNTALPGLEGRPTESAHNARRGRAEPGSAASSSGCTERRIPVNDPIQNVWLPWPIRAGGRLLVLRR
jgi:hypothetical protein